MPGDHFLRIAGITIAVRCADASIDWEWDAPSSRFLVPSTTDTDVELTVVAGAPAPNTGELLFDSGAVWRLFRDGDGFRIECRAEAFGDVPYKVAVFDATFERGTIYLLPESLFLNASPLQYPIDELLIGQLLARGRGIELHSCGVIDAQGRGHLFAGSSGAGKTTTAHLWRDTASAIVSDDRVVIREHDGALWMYGTPWHGEAELSVSARAPLHGVYLLQQAPVNELRAISDASAIVRLFGCAFPIFHDNTAVEFTLAFLQRIVSTVPVRELRFTRDAAAVALVLEQP